MRSRSHPLHRLIVDEDDDIVISTNETVDSVAELCSQLENIRDRLDRLQASRLGAYLELTIQVLKRESSTKP